MKVKLVFSNWMMCGKSIYQTEEGVLLTTGDFHSGATFEADIDVLDEENEEELKAALQSGYEPVFYALLADDVEKPTDQ